MPDNRDKKKLDAHIGSVGTTVSMNENKAEWRKPESVREGQERSRARCFLFHRGNHERTYPRSEIRIELKSWPSQLKPFAKVQEILSREKRWGFAARWFFLSPLRRLPSGRRIGRH